MKPVVKWAGGKTQLLGTIAPLLPETITYYVEPFIGGGALYLNLVPNNAWINDANPELINAYEVIKDNPNELIDELKTYKNTAEFFYQIRNEDRDKNSFQKWDNIKRAARFLYLNHTCFNGLYRVNSKDEFNVPFGRYKNPDIVHEAGINELSKFLNKTNPKITCMDFEDVLKDVPKDSFVYLDPPYDSEDETNVFNSYVKRGFSKADQICLRDCCDKLNENGIKFMVSNAPTDFILDIYSGYSIMIVRAKRYVGSKSEYMHDAKEVIIRNY